MKTIYTLLTVILIALSLNIFADDKVKGKEKSSAVSAAPFIWGDPEVAAPAWLGSLKAKNALVPVAPFVWGSPEDEAGLRENVKMIVPVAPFTYGDPDSDIPAGLQFVRAVNADVPVAPFVFGDPEADAPEGI